MCDYMNTNLGYILSRIVSELYRNIHQIIAFDMGRGAFNVYSFVGEGELINSSRL